MVKRPLLRIFKRREKRVCVCGAPWQRSSEPRVKRPHPSFVSSANHYKPHCHGKKKSSLTERERERKRAAAGYFQADLPVSLKQFTSNISSLILHQSF
ncbi:hypothetical protein P3S67_004791 [Capsicum chacoense]